MSVLVVGSIAIDTVKTPVEEHSDLLGGSGFHAQRWAQVSFRQFGWSVLWATIFRNRNFSFGDRARSIAKACSERMEKLSAGQANIRGT